MGSVTDSLRYPTSLDQKRPLTASFWCSWRMACFAQSDTRKWMLRPCDNLLGCCNLSNKGTNAAAPQMAFLWPDPMPRGNGPWWPATAHSTSFRLPKTCTLFNDSGLNLKVRRQASVLRPAYHDCLLTTKSTSDCEQAAHCGPLLLQHW